MTVEEFWCRTLLSVKNDLIHQLDCDEMDCEIHTGSIITRIESAEKAAVELREKIRAEEAEAAKTAVPTTSLLNKRILVRGDYGGTKAVRVKEISPKGNWLSVMDQNGDREWVACDKITLIEILDDREPKPPEKPQKFPRTLGAKMDFFLHRAKSNVHKYFWR